MQYRKLGKTGLEVSELGYGAARGAKDNPEQFIATVHAAIEGGVNFIDTAEMYDGGHAERVLGEALKGHHEVIVETKYLPYESFAPEAKFTGTPEKMRAACEQSLQRLQRDRLDVFMGHGMRTHESYERFMQDGCYEEMVKLRHEGKVRFLGISELSEADGTHEVLQKAVPSGAFDVVMLTVNFLLQTAIDSVLPLAEKHGVGTVVMMPLNQAWKGSGLVGVEQAHETIRRHIEYGNLPNESPYTGDDLFDFLKPYSIPEAALRFVLAQNVSTCCVGARHPDRIRQNIQASDPPYLTDTQLARLKELFSRIEWQVR